MSLKAILKLVAIALVITSCSNSNDLTHYPVSLESSQIINGKPVVEADLYAKYTVALGPAQGDQICTGVIIDQHYILTAGHCVEGIKKGVIYFGLVATKKTATVYKIKKITRHPRYCDSCLLADEILSNGNDLALVEFENELPEGYEPVGLATIDQIKTGNTVYMAGFGADEKQKYDVLKVTHVDIKQIGDTEFKTNEIKTGTCNGDSGGPSFIMKDDQLLLIGITSRGDVLCRNHGIYTIPDAHLDWILEVIVGE